MEDDANDALSAEQKSDAQQRLRERMEIELLWEVGADGGGATIDAVETGRKLVRKNSLRSSVTDVDRTRGRRRGP